MFLVLGTAIYDLVKKRALYKFIIVLFIHSTEVFCFVLNSLVLNSMKDFLLGPAPLLVKLSASAKKPVASIVMKVSSDSSDGGVTVGHSSGVKQDLEDNTYQNVRKVALDSICR